MTEQKIAASLLCLSLLASPALADDQSPERGKINTADASPVDPGHYEVEAVYAYASSTRAWDNEGDSHARGFASQHALAVSATVGLLENMDVSICGSHAWLEDKGNDFDEDGTAGPTKGDGVGDLDINGRYRFYQNEAAALDLAYIAGFTIPTGTNSGPSEIGTSQEYWSFNQTLAASKDWGKWTANAALGYAQPFGDDQGDARGSVKADLAAGYQALAWLQPELELNYVHSIEANENDADTIALTSGIVMPLNDRVRINTGLQQGVWGQNANKTTTFSFAVKLAF